MSFFENSMELRQLISMVSNVSAWVRSQGDEPPDNQYKLYYQ